MNRSLEEHLNIDIRYCYRFNSDEYGVDYYDKCMERVAKLCDEKHIENKDLIVLATAFHKVAYNPAKAVLNNKYVIMYYGLEKRHKISQIITEYINNEKDCLPETQILYDAINNN